MTDEDRAKADAFAVMLDLIFSGEESDDLVIYLHTRFPMANPFFVDLPQDDLKEAIRDYYKNKAGIS